MGTHYAQRQMFLWRLINQIIWYYFLIVDLFCFQLANQWHYQEIKLQTYFLLYCPDTLFIGRNHIEVPSVNSTNEYAPTLLSKSKPPEGTVISTQDQYAGRGQIGSSWESQPGKNISLSIILYPIFLPIAQQFLLNQCISLAIFDLADKYFPKKTEIKWPNDIYVKGKKVAGILIQNTISGSQRCYIFSMPICGK